MGFQPQDVQDNKVLVLVIAVLQLYCPILFFIPYVAKKESDFCCFFSNQGLWLLIIYVAGGVINIIPLLGQVASVVIFIFGLVVGIMNVVHVVKEERIPIPFVGANEILK